MKKGFTCGAAAVLAAALAAGAAQAAATGTAAVHSVRAAAPVRGADTGLATSSNWAGYAATGSTFTDVEGSWTQPSVACPAYGSTYSAFWVGLGGYANGSSGLEQVGTEADCRGGQQVSTVWYELIPAPPVDIPIAVAAGDQVAAEVSVSGTTVTLSLTDTTTGQTAGRQLTVASPDLSSAEWVAEAPSQCGYSLRACSVLPLASFGTVSFSGASATGGGVDGTISNGAWSSQAIQLGGGYGSTTAVPSSLSPDGTSFTVTTETATPSVAPPTSPRGREDWRPWGWGRGRGRGHLRGDWR